MLITVLKPTEGTATVCGHDIVKEANMVRRKIGVVPQEYTADEDLTGYENIILCADLYGIPREISKKRAMELLELVHLHVHFRSGHSLNKHNPIMEISKQIEPKHP